MKGGMNRTIPRPAPQSVAALGQMQAEIVGLDDQRDESIDRRSDADAATTTRNKPSTADRRPEWRPARWS